VRRSAIDWPIRVRGRIADWPRFLREALAKEDGVGNRFRLRSAQVLHDGASAEASSVGELISTFVRLYGSGNYYFGGEADRRCTHDPGAVDRSATRGADGMFGESGFMGIPDEPLEVVQSAGEFRRDGAVPRGARRKAIKKRHLSPRRKQRQAETAKSFNLQD